MFTGFTTSNTPLATYATGEIINRTAAENKPLDDEDAALTELEIAREYFLEFLKDNENVYALYPEENQYVFHKKIRIDFLLDIKHIRIFL